MTSLAGSLQLKDAQINFVPRPSPKVASYQYLQQTSGTGEGKAWWTEIVYPDKGTMVYFTNPIKPMIHHRKLNACVFHGTVGVTLETMHKMWLTALMA